MVLFKDPVYKALTADQRRCLDLATHFAEGFLRFIPRKIKNYPSHGVDHSLNIIKLINSFSQNWGLALKRDERFVLYLAAWLHDIGCIKTRSGHGRKSVQILIKDPTLCNYLNAIDNDILISLNDVIKSHGSRYPIETLVEVRGKVRVRLIASIFRLMDACEITNYKCPAAVYDEIKQTFKKRQDGRLIPDSEAIDFWVGHMNIKDVNFTRPDIEVLVNKRNQSKTIIQRLRNEIKSIKRIFQENHLTVPIVKVKT